MASQPDVLQQCLREGARASRLALERCIDQAVAALQYAENQATKMADRDELSGAWRVLQDNKAVWAARYPADLQQAFNQGVQAAEQATRAADLSPTAPPLTPRAASRGRSALDSFSLVDDADVDQAITSSRLLQHILPRVELPLAELDTLISSAQGLANVRPELNPLRPEVYTRVLQDLLATAGVSPPVFAIWIRQLSDPLGRELKDIYEKLNRQLEQAHVKAAHYRVLQTPLSAMGRGGRGGPGSGQADGKPGDGKPGDGNGNGNGQSAEPSKQPSQYADLSDYEIRDELFQDFLFHGGSNANHGLAPSYYATVEEELAALGATPDTPDSAPGHLHDSSLGALDAENRRQASHQQQHQQHYRDMPAVDRPPRFVDVLSQLSSQVWGAYGRSRERALVRTQLKKEATKVGQVLGLEVVRKLVNQVAQDPRLLVPVRESIVALEPSLLRLAMVDPRFFSDEGHPGRRLMERVAQRSFKYNDEYSADFAAFFQPVTQAFNGLNASNIEDAQPFGMALATLEHGWDEQDQLDSQNRHQVLQALRFAEERQERADQIAFDLSSRSDLDKVPAVVLDFLFGPWALAMAHARLVDQRNQIDPGGYGSVVPDLLWSVKRDVTLKRPAKLIEMIPGLLDKLHSGLAQLGQDPKENTRFFDALMKLHQPVLKLRRLKSKRDAEESGAIPLDALDASEMLDSDDMPATAEQRRAHAAEQPWLGRDDLDAAGFEDTLPTENGELSAMQQLMESAYSQPVKTSAPAQPAAAAATAAAAAPDESEFSQLAAITAASLGGQVPAQPVPAPAPARPASAAAATEDSSLAALHDGLQETTADTSALAQSKAEAEALLMSLSTGSWVDLYSRRRWLRAQLIWASAKGTLFMFVSHGGQPHSMTKRSCEKLIMQRLLRPVDTHGVVAQALHAVAAEVSTPAPATSQPASRSKRNEQDETETA